MKTKLLAIAMLLCVPGLSFAQTIESCPGCVLSIFDAPDLRCNYGTFEVGTFIKKLYLGIKYDPNATFDGLTTIEFSIEGLPSTPSPPTFVISNSGFVVPGWTNVATPSDTTAEGGVNVAWGECQPGNMMLVEITLVIIDPVPVDTVIRIRRKYPESPFVGVRSPVFTQCNLPLATPTTVPIGCYVMNPSVVDPQVPIGDPPCTILCTTPVKESTWSEIKALFR